MAQIKARGSNSVDLIGKHYEGTVKVDGAGKAFLRENAGSIYYDGYGDIWRVGGEGTSTSLAKAMYRAVKGRAPKKGTRVKFENGDSTDFRAGNLIS